MVPAVAGWRAVSFVSGSPEPMEMPVVAWAVVEEVDSGNTKGDNVTHEVVGICVLSGEEQLEIIREDKDFWCWLAPGESVNNADFARAREKRLIAKLDRENRKKP